MINLLTLSALLLVLIGCSSAPSNPVKDKALHIPFTHTGWKSIEPEQADLAWSHKERGDVMLANSLCGEFQEQTLKDLAYKTIESFGEANITTERELQWLDREAYETEGHAIIDGVKVFLLIRNYRRDHCYYDFVLITPRSRANQSLLAFKKMLDQVRFNQ